MTDERIMTMLEVATLCRVHYETVRRWVEDGKLAVVQPAERGKILIERSEVERFLSGREKT